MLAGGRGHREVEPPTTDPSLSCWQIALPSTLGVYRSMSAGGFQMGTEREEPSVRITCTRTPSCPTGSPNGAAV